MDTAIEKAFITPDRVEPCLAHGFRPATPPPRSGRRYPTVTELDLDQIWAATPAQLERHEDAGFEALITEDIVRFVTIHELVAAGVAPVRLEPEWRRTSVTGSALNAIEIKYPANSAKTMPPGPSTLVRR